MGKLLNYILCFQFLAISFVPSGKVMELYKLNNLLSHFTHHQIIHKEDINFIEFLVLHYLDNKHQHKDCSEHEDLPFHSTSSQNATASISLFFTKPPSFSWNFGRSAAQIQVKQIFAYQVNYFSSFHFSIWQPPRV